MIAVDRAVTVLGRYSLHDEIAAGGMAAVHLGRLLGPVGFSRTVAIKRLHAHYAKDPEFVSMFLDEARLAARIRHPNVVQTLDVVATDGELFLVMEYVQGDALSRLFRASAHINQPLRVEFAASIIGGALHGLHAAHEARGEQGEPLDIVHRDVSPHNILVGVDGVTRLLDFGVAKASGRIQTTRDGQIKGKLAYMAPEQIRGLKVDRRTDVYAAGTVLWEALTGKRLYEGESDVAIYGKVLEGKPPPPSKLRPNLPAELDAITLRALAADPNDRYPTAREMARAIEKVIRLVPAADIGEWVEHLAAESLSVRSRKIARIESATSNAPPLVVPTPAELSGLPEVPRLGTPNAGGGFENEPATLVRRSGSNEIELDSGDLQDATPTQTTTSVTKPDLMIPRPSKRNMIAIAAGAFVVLAVVVALRPAAKPTAIEPASAIEHEATPPGAASSAPTPNTPREAVPIEPANPAKNVVELEPAGASSPSVHKAATPPPPKTAGNVTSAQSPPHGGPNKAPTKSGPRLGTVLDSRK